MSDILIRHVPDGVHATLKEKSAADGKALEGWLREQLVKLAAMPTIRKSYGFKMFGENGARATIKRLHDGYVQQGSNGCSQEQYDAYQKAALLAKRNELGDYEAAYNLLFQSFDEVFPS